MSTATRILLVAVFVFATGAAHAEGLTGDNMKSLDGQVQEIKSDVLDIASELQNLEERLRTLETRTRWLTVALIGALALSAWAMN